MLGIGKQSTARRLSRAGSPARSRQERHGHGHRDDNRPLDQESRVVYPNKSGGIRNRGLVETSFEERKYLQDRFPIPLETLVLARPDHGTRRRDLGGTRDEVIPCRSRSGRMLLGGSDPWRGGAPGPGGG